MTSSSYWKKRYENPFKKIKESERIYLKVPYMNRGFAKSCRCAFDRELKLWYTGCCNSFLRELIEVYGVHDRTGDEARNLIDEALNGDRERLIETFSKTKERDKTGTD